MDDNSVINCIYIIRSQAEYIADTQSMVVRCTLEVPTTGQRCGFSDVEDLLSALRLELTATHNHGPPSEPK